MQGRDSYLEDIDKRCNLVLICFNLSDPAIFCVDGFQKSVACVLVDKRRNFVKQPAW
jgi:hypothetical protein